MTKLMITPEIVLAAKNGKSEALATVVQFFKSYISNVSIRPFYDEYGKRYDFVDEEICKHIESRLLFQIVYSFDPYRMLNGEELTED